MRLIDADDIIYDSIDSEDTNRHAYYYGTGIMAARKEDIDAMPTIELPERMGRWISLDDFRGKYNENGYKCSECGEYSGYEENYCSNCGARMVKQGEEHD